MPDFITLYDAASVFPQDAVLNISEAKYLFLYDVDHKTPSDVAIWMQKQFAVIEDTEWKLDKWSITDNDRGVIQDEKALYVWADENGKGTLEAFLFPIYKISSTKLLNKSQMFVEDAFSWNVAGNSVNQKYKKKAEKSKAILCAAGQGERPGRPLRARPKITLHFKRRSILPDCVTKTYKYLDIPTFSRLARQAPQYLKLPIYF